MKHCRSTQTVKRAVHVKTLNVGQRGLAWRRVWPDKCIRRNVTLPHATTLTIIYNAWSVRPSARDHEVPDGRPVDAQQLARFSRNAQPDIGVPERPIRTLSRRPALTKYGLSDLTSFSLVGSMRRRLISDALVQTSYFIDINRHRICINGISFPRILYVRKCRQYFFYLFSSYILCSFSFPQNYFTSPAVEN